MQLMTSPGVKTIATIYTHTRVSVKSLSTLYTANLLITHWLGGQPCILYIIYIKYHPNMSTIDGLREQHLWLKGKNSTHTRVIFVFTTSTQKHTHIATHIWQHIDIDGTQKPSLSQLTPVSARLIEYALLYSCGYWAPVVLLCVEQQEILPQG